MYRSLSSLTVAAVVALTGCAEAPLEPVDQNLDRTSISVASESSARAPAPGNESIAEVAIGAGFSELVEALAYVDAELDAGLVDLFLNGTDQHTVFAPDNAAFMDLYDLLGGVLGAPIDDVTDLPAEVVLDVLLYHVAEGRRAANSVLPRNGERKIRTLLGETFVVRTDGTIGDGLTGVRPDDAAIATPNISARNGIVHVITEVIVPSSVVAAITS